MGRNHDPLPGDHYQSIIGNSLKETETAKIAALKKAITEGLQSGSADNFIQQIHLEQLKSAKWKKTD